jgi:hypothetical protein
MTNVFAWVTPSRSAHRQHFRRGVRPGWETTGILRHGWNNQDLDGWQIEYLHANIELKEKALAKTEPIRGRCGRY